MNWISIITGIFSSMSSSIHNSAFRFVECHFHLLLKRALSLKSQLPDSIAFKGKVGLHLESVCALSSPPSEMWKYANWGASSVNGEALRRDWSPLLAKNHRLCTTWWGHGPLCVAWKGPPGRRPLPIDSASPHNLLYGVFLRADRTKTHAHGPQRQQPPRGVSQAYNIVAWCARADLFTFALAASAKSVWQSPYLTFFISLADLRSFNIFLRKFRGNAQESRHTTQTTFSLTSH